MTPDERSSLLQEFLASLPSSPIESLSVEVQARAILRLVIEEVQSSSAQPMPKILVDPSTCPNCDAPTLSLKTPYCGPTCRNISAFIRQFRGALADGQIFDPERQEGLGQVFWYLVGGGRPLRQHIVPDRTKLDLFKKAGGICTICGAAGTQIDHIATGCNRPINLRVVCDACCRTKPFGDPSVLRTSEYLQLTTEFASRIVPEVAVRCCDDPKNWDWRAYLALRHELG